MKNKIGKLIRVGIRSKKKDKKIGVFRFVYVIGLFNVIRLFILRRKR